MTNQSACNRLVIGNWKMNASLEANDVLLRELVSQAGTVPNTTQVAVCAPFPYLSQVQQLLADSPIQWGAQDISAEASGAYTGEVSAAMLNEFACRWVLVGHSERRSRHAESSVAVVQKAQAAVKAGITPVFCLGETDDEHESGHTHSVVQAQLEPLLALGAEFCSQVVVAYEPVWAIGTGKSATPEQAQAVHAFIRELFTQINAPTVPLLYGGSVNGDNAASLFAMPDINGALVGGASLNATEFLRIAAA